ncbi:Pectin lyase-like superfamily protein [Perilla frutescens var. hirtella]|nr:Pectin lyase-like superfamily protein [Perilla frutescens var. hirtella]
MVSYKWCVCTFFVALFSSISSITGEDGEGVVSQTIIVDPSGSGGFRTIQAAINSVPSNNQQWTTINIKQGVYKEQVLIPRDKPFIYLKGAGRKYTFIVWDGHESIDNATFASEADNTLARDITFSNSYNSKNPNPIARAVAAKIKGDKSAFYGCAFLGVQDTLWDAQGRHYYKSCTIKGAVDFIFGAAQTHYESCNISVDTSTLNGKTAGYIAAQGRENGQDTNGFVFKGCNIDGNGTTYLGRGWRPYSRVLFYNTQMSDIIVPQGWDAWKAAGKESLLTLSEYNCSGPGANSSGRVAWEKKLSEGEVNQLTNISFIDNEGWVKIALNILGG